MQGFESAFIICQNKIWPVQFSCKYNADDRCGVDWRIGGCSLTKGDHPLLLSIFFYIFVSLSLFRGSSSFLYGCPDLVVVPCTLEMTALSRHSNAERTTDCQSLSVISGIYDTQSWLKESETLPNSVLLLVG